MGSENIANTFSGIYSQLFNKVESDPELVDIRSKISNNIGTDCSLKFTLVTEEIVGKAIGMLKSGKSDAVFDVSSDFLS